jgi:ketosteroid isomerase-like protein
VIDKTLFPQGENMSDSDLLRTLQDKEDIKALLVDYVVALDTRNWTALEAVFTDDVHVNYGDVEKLDGKANVLKMISSTLGKCGPTQHLLGNYRIEVRGDNATSACYLRAMHAGKGDDKDKVWDLWAEYVDELVRTAAGWRISQRIERSFHMTGDISVLGLDAEVVKEVLKHAGR